MASKHQDREYRDDDYVYDFSVEPLPEISALAHKVLEVLLESEGLRRGGVDASSDDRARPAEMNNGHTIWLRRAERRTRGYRPVVVEDEPSRTAMATLAALTVLEGKRADMERLNTVLPYLDLADEPSTERSLSEAFEKLREQSSYKRGRFISDLMAHRPLLFAHALLRHYRPDLDDLPREDQVNLLIQCCKRVNEVLNSVRLLSEFLEYGGPDRNQRPAVEDPHRYVRAALLADVEGLTHREIADILRIDRPRTTRGGRDYSAVRQMVVRGQDILERAYGPEGYAEMVENMKAELADNTS